MHKEPLTDTTAHLSVDAARTHTRTHTHTHTHTHTEGERKSPSPFPTLILVGSVSAVLALSELIKQH